MCAYAQLFNPYLTDKEQERTSNRFNNKPRPFVFEPETNQQELFYPGQKIRFNLNLFGVASKYLPYIIEAWNYLAEQGIGSGRGKFIVSEIWNVNQLKGKSERVYSEYANIVHNPEFNIDKRDIKELKKCLDKEKLRLRFSTSTLLKNKGDFVEKIDFYKLMKNLFRRLSSLSVFYGEEELDIEFHQYLEQAKEIELIKDTTSWKSWYRYSNRQNKRIKMKGLVGEVAYQGSLEKFLPYLILGQYSHIGKNTVFGLGNYKILK
ncbi:CRISPR system precrRNA processing endoribonuclease RAMP protein Cas6 [Sporohalobacter salinus]|uniref:CRISPR system precrRNA processing endoribonuclease RAMP protein Cas6 n=1 Tax=Sporohalobacter salinus TaxID=1494606 RepID=UPI00195F352F|nr:CRISPR system precrRNA processing endoribonuclease RAMP protein Cas6 [Sporohalobacter salinus]MBM7623683.1 CRISPR-associated endoribonuclease Cas6 [Sporohalobacter salinus]